MNTNDLLEKVKKNLIISFDDDDELIEDLITKGIRYAENRQHLETGYYDGREMSQTTEHGVILYASHFYESRDGSTGGFWNDKTDAAAAAKKAYDYLFLQAEEYQGGF